MRVISTTTLLLQDINPENRGARYAILSHTWGSEEVFFDDIRNLGPRELATKVRKKGASKIIGSCIQAEKDRCDYIWIDTCCIDKSSSAELSEAINSMFKWYALAEQCYAYLGDVSMATPEKDMWSLRRPAPEEDDMWSLRRPASEEDDMWFLRSLAALASLELIKRTDLVSRK